MRDEIAQVMCQNCYIRTPARCKKCIHCGQDKDVRNRAYKPERPRFTYPKQKEVITFSAHYAGTKIN